MIKEIITHSEKETFDLAEKLGAGATRGAVFALYGELGTGKTIIAKGIAKGLGITDDITSPTFLMEEIYEAQIPLYHFDLYRMNSPDELDELDFEESWDGEGVSVIEWAERAESRLPANAIKIKLDWISETERRILIEYPDN
jgi:tRNA threonylcarbamoyladenosine biosynthesis protein TsaE